MLLNLKNPKFQEVLEIVESLTDEEQEHLVKIIQNRRQQKEKTRIIECRC